MCPHGVQIAGICASHAGGGRGVDPPTDFPREMSPPLPNDHAAQKMKTPELERRTVKNGVFEGEQVKLTCAHCNKTYWTRASHAERSKHCSLECRKAAPKERKVKEMTELIARTELTPTESAKIRGQIASYMRDQITDAHQVVMGAKSWNPTQARVFSTMLNKVVPDLNASYVQHEHSTKQVTDLSRDELEAIAQGVSTLEVEYQEISNHEDQ